MSDFVHLHLHSQYSLLDGANRLDDVLNAGVAEGMPAMALTDHGNMFGAVEFYKKARKKGIKPIIGMEAYVAPFGHEDRTPGQGSSNHLVLLAHNETGYRNLLKLTTRSFLQGFYYKPRIDHDLLSKHSEGLTALSACLKGEINEKIIQRRRGEAEETAKFYRDTFGPDNFYLELQDHGIPEQHQANEILLEIAKKYEIPKVITNDTHYLKKDDAFAHDVLLCIGTQKTVDDPDRLRYSSEEFYLKSADEMFRLFPQEKDAIENTVKIADKCHLDLDFSQFHLPEFPVPEGETLVSYLETVAREGLQERLDQHRKAQNRSERAKDISAEVYWARLERELGVIANMGFPGYFLITWDFIRYARDQRIPVGPGRGSAAGSLVSYALRITDIDPLPYDLLFERFLNPERVSMPDIDIDFCMRRRGEVIHYVSEKYGRDKVAQIITFGTLAAKAVIRDVGRVMGLPYAKVDRVAKMVPDMTRSLEEAAKEIAPLREEVKRDPEVRKVIEVGCRLEGLTRHHSMHAAGVVITPQPLEELVPLCKTNKDEVLTQWDKDVVEDLGLLKMDFLGLRTLTVIDDTLQNLRLQGIDLDLDALPLDDPETYRLFCEGRTSGIFQFESSGMKELLRRAKPERFEDLAAFNALYRPGALSVGMVEELIRRKQGKKKVRYILPETEPILQETYGVIAYQEQVMQVAVDVAGFTLGEADVLRKAMGKKKIEVMAEQKAKFLDGASARGKDRRKAEELWNYIEPFAGYGFNKSHSVAYAMLAYNTAYLKAHHPVAFMAAMLSSEMSSKDNVAKYILECREMGIPVLPPTINESLWSFTVVGETIRFGLGAVKGIGESAVESILQARRTLGKFRSTAHFVQEIDLRAVNHKALESLIKSGALDEFENPRASLMDFLDPVLDYANRRKREKELGQSSLFGVKELGEPAPNPKISEWPKSELLSYEKEALGFFLSGNPLEEFEGMLTNRITHDTLRLREEEGAENVRVAGVVSRVKKRKIKSGRNAGRMMAGFTLEDQHGSISATIFPDGLERYQGLIHEDAVILIHGNAKVRGTELELNIEKVESLGDLKQPPKGHLLLRLPKTVSRAQLLKLRDLLVENSGELPVMLSMLHEGVDLSIKPAARFRVVDEEGLRQRIERLIGAGAAVRVDS